MYRLSLAASTTVPRSRLWYTCQHTPGAATHATGSHVIRNASKSTRAAPLVNFNSRVLAMVHAHPTHAAKPSAVDTANAPVLARRVHPGIDARQSSSPASSRARAPRAGAMAATPAPMAADAAQRSRSVNDAVDMVGGSWW
mmetsp:Transcript_2679/g.11488  ORF Transcript_2679/g.11488 Transcript_2679/m.11488 type:complete len:141 (-) Transcript_2679:348-770(-)